MCRTILVLVLLQVVAVDLGTPAVLRVSSHHVVLSASRQPPQGAPSTRSRRGPRAVARVVVAGAPEPPSGPLDCSSCCSACTVLCTVVGPTVPEATTWPWARPSLQHHDESTSTVPHTRCPDRQECGPHDDPGPFTKRPTCCSSSASQTSEVPGSLQATGDRDRSHRSSPTTNKNLKP